MHLQIQIIQPTFQLSIFSFFELHVGDMFFNISIQWAILLGSLWTCVSLHSQEIRLRSWWRQTHTHNLMQKWINHLTNPTPQPREQRGVCVLCIVISEPGGRRNEMNFWKANLLHELFLLHQSGGCCYVPSSFHCLLSDCGHSCHHGSSDERRLLLGLLRHWSEINKNTGDVLTYCTLSAQDRACFPIKHWTQNRTAQGQALLPVWP